jgi:hypothetical protein
MAVLTPHTPEEFFAGHEDGLAVYRSVTAAVAALGDYEERVSRSQIALRHGRSFAFVWRPGQYLRSEVPAVLSIALRRRVESPRIKEVVRPAPRVWMHHLEMRSPGEVDDQVAQWLAEAYLDQAPDPEQQRDQAGQAEGQEPGPTGRGES